MDCAEFERELVKLMDGGSARNAKERDRSLGALEAHAADCDACAGCEELLQLLGLPRGQGDLASDPGQAYWDAFDRRVRERVGRESTRTRAGRRWWMGAAAAVVLLGVVGTWTFRRGAMESNPPAAELPEELARMVETASGDLLVWEVPDDAGPWGAGRELFPDVSDLDGDVRQAFLLWLREQTS
jgi:hypothetical protein